VTGTAVCEFTACRRRYFSVVNPRIADSDGIALTNDYSPVGTGTCTGRANMCQLS